MSRKLSGFILSIVAVLILSGCNAFVPAERNVSVSVPIPVATVPVPPTQQPVSYTSNCPANYTCVQTDTTARGSTMSGSQYAWQPQLKPTASVPRDGYDEGRYLCPNPGSDGPWYGINLHVFLSTGYWHFNVAVPGQGKGIEENFLVYYEGPEVEVVVPEGSVWWYRKECFENAPKQLDFLSGRESMDDFWPNYMPTWLAGTGALLIQPEWGFTDRAPEPTPNVWTTPSAPQGNQPEYNNPGNLPAATPIPQSENGQSDVPREPQAGNTYNCPQGVVNGGQGKNITVTVPPGYYELAWYFDGGDGEHMTWFEATQQTTVGPFNGTLSCWQNLPALHDMNKHIRTMVHDLPISISPAVKDFEPRP